MTMSGRSDRPDISPDELRERIRAIVSLIAEHAASAEQQRKPADEVIDALRATGVFRAFVPKRYGGLEIDLDLFVDIGAMISEACASTGWITTFYMEHNWILGRFSRELQDEIFGAQPYILAPGTVNPSGRAVRRDDHYEVTGQWQFATGVVHADWVLLSARLEDDPVPRLFLVPIDEVEVKDTWHVDGMAATGSRDIIARGVKVPPARMSGVSPPTWELPLDAPYLDRIPMRPFLSLTAAIPSIGCARRAIAVWQERLPTRVMFGTTKRQSELESTHIRLGNLLVRADNAELSMRTAARQMTAHARGEIQLSMLDHMRLRLVIAQVVRACRDIVRDVLEAAGASVHYLDNELQRIHRDMHMIAAHTVFDLDLVAAEYGRAVLEASGQLTPSDRAAQPSEPAGKSSYNPFR